MNDSKREYMRQYMKEYRKNKEDYYKKHARYVYNWRKRNPLKYKAHTIVSEAVKWGKLTKPKVCENCKKLIKIYAHHEDYNFPLLVIWLCDSCHKEIHK